MYVCCVRHTAQIHGIVAERLIVATKEIRSLMAAVEVWKGLILLQVQTFDSIVQ